MHIKNNFFHKPSSRSAGPKFHHNSNLDLGSVQTRCSHGSMVTMQHGLPPVMGAAGRHHSQCRPVRPSEEGGGWVGGSLLGFIPSYGYRSCTIYNLQDIDPVLRGLQWTHRLYVVCMWTVDTIPGPSDSIGALKMYIFDPNFDARVFIFFGKFK